MGNTVTREEEPSDQEIVHRMSYSEISSEPSDNIKNGPVAIEAAQLSASKGETVDARVNGIQDNVAVSSPKTMEISSISEANGNNLGKEAKTAPPAAKSRFVFAFSRPVPGRTEEPATNSAVASAQLDVSSEAPPAKATSETLDLPAAAVPEEASDKNLREASLTEIELSEPATSEAEDATSSKPKELTFFDRLFKLDKGKDKNQAQVQSQGEVKAENPATSITVEETSGLQSTPENALLGKDIACEENPVQQESLGVDCLASEDIAQEEVKPENVKTASGTDYNSVMSFFKTLVSPSKADSKSDTEDKATQAGKTHGGQLAEKTMADSHAKGTKKKKPDSPRLGHSTFSKLFRHKSKKDAQQTANIQSTEQPVAIDNVKSEANIPPAQEIPAIKQNIKAPEPPAQQQAPPAPAVIITNEIPKEVTKERSASTPTPLSKFFWKKTPTDDIEVINTERMEAAPEAPAKTESRSLEAAETRSKGEEKPSKTNLRKFFKLSARDDAGITPSEEVNVPTPNQQTLDFPDRPFTQAESRESAGARSKESSTETLNKEKGSKQEAKEPQEPSEQEGAETDSLQNGRDATKENVPKRTEKKQSFGGFFKGLSPKRMSDAEVQTDPVSFVPAPAKPK
ncbi:breast carcinoma-amplified sequence 1 isoform X1 [Eublepharis macularius]|uniref:Breast carcinoma-amplified sequence 1 isoform X1 n=1 Tax=Eublepharis macularius TaxID=481883 RepID=A0AA97JIG3_EUBMA|nr:breast carcinoma-amplified sequence 1 isoform X1 [Eublepharis macularius]